MLWQLSFFEQLAINNDGYHGCKSVSVRKQWISSEEHCFLVSVLLISFISMCKAGLIWGFKVIDLFYNAESSSLLQLEVYNSKERS